MTEKQGPGEGLPLHQSSNRTRRRDPRAVVRCDGRGLPLDTHHLLPPDGLRLDLSADPRDSASR